MNLLNKQTNKHFQADFDIMNYKFHKKINMDI